jgi:site-specific DNA-methyltransferase (cytosine-N4-specific)
MEALEINKTGAEFVANAKVSEIERQRIEKKFRPLMQEELKLGNLVSYVGNKSAPFLRLYRFKEAFAFDFVRNFIKRFNLTPKDYVFDPFAGMGTTLFASMLEGIPSIGVDKLPIATFVAKTIPNFLSIPNGKLISTFKNLKLKLNKINSDAVPIAMDVPLMKSAFNQKNLSRLRQWKGVIDELQQPLRDIFLLLFFSILEETSYTSKDGQFLRLKRSKNPANPDEALYRKVMQAEEDINRVKLFKSWDKIEENLLPKVFLGDSRDLKNILFERPPTAIITSPPYPNRYDYTRSYCLELCFHFVKNFEELKAIRFSILRSHIESKVSSNEKPPHPVVQEVVDALNMKELNNPRIPYMLIGYFVDMEKVICQWSNILARGAQVAMVVDNVRFEGELVPVDLILSEMAENVGFEIKKIIISRYKGNSSQQMKKYGRIPVRESIVVWKKL